MVSDIVNHHFLNNKPEIRIQNNQCLNNPELLQNHRIRPDKSADPLLQNYQDLEPKSKFEPLPPVNYAYKQRNYIYRNESKNSNHDMIAPHKLENQHFPPLSTPQRWDNKSLEAYTQEFKISNIPAPYPSTAVCDLSDFDNKTPKSINDGVNFEQYSRKDVEDSCYHQNLNHNPNYQYNNPHPAVAHPPSENSGSLTALYDFNNINVNTYNEHFNENSDSPHSNYHQQMSKYSYGYYQPTCLSNYASSNKVYDNNTFQSVSNQYYMQRPSTFSTSSINGVDVGFNYAEPQGWMKKHLPD